MASLNDYIVNLNIFGSSNDDNNTIEDRQRHRLYINATRIYLCLVILVLLIVCIVSSLSEESRIVQVDHPSINQFENLPIDAECRCSQSSLTYSDFSSIQIQLHQVCTSDFISNRWLKAITIESNVSNSHFEDFRFLVNAQFQTLTAFCRLSQSHMEQNLIRYRTMTLLTTQTLSPAMFHVQTQFTLNEFFTTLLHDFSNEVRIIQQMIVSNQLLSKLQTNFRLKYVNSTDNQWILDVQPVSYQQSDGSICNCDSNLYCIGMSGIVNSSEDRIPGMVSGCLPVDSTLASTLECFYDQKCLDDVLTFFPTTEKFTAMNITLPSRFYSNESIQNIVDQSMIEKFMTNSSYESYYSHCTPRMCTYSLMKKNDLWKVLFQLISILGGTTMVLGLLIPMTIRGIERVQFSDGIAMNNTCK